MDRPFCFVIMPFRPELHYFYLFLKRHVELHHNLDCERGDAQILTTPILDKINADIQRASVIIADCTGRNANVFYELGIAHSVGKPVILITQDEVTEAPSDIRHYEFIKYSSRDTEFAAHLDNALGNVFSGRHDDLYRQAQRVFKRFKEQTGARVTETTKSSFADQLNALQASGEFPSGVKGLEMTEILLTKIIADPSDPKVMRQITKWLDGPLEPTRRSKPASKR